MPSASAIDAPEDVGVGTAVVTPVGIAAAVGLTGCEALAGLAGFPPASGSKPKKLIWSVLLISRD
jgi:hypothetical protein